MELYRYLQQQGFGSRKVCCQLIDSHLVEINGQIAADYRRDIQPNSVTTLVVNGQRWEPVKLPLSIMLHKPRGYETSHQPVHHPSVFALLPWQFVIGLKIMAVGRLDVDTTGLLLLTTDGQWSHSLTSPRRCVPKCYQVWLKYPISDAFLNHLAMGVYLKPEDKTVTADSIEIIDAATILLTISQGKYHQIKRMVAIASNRVVRLHRLKVGSLELGNLAEGTWRHLTAEECQTIKGHLEKS